MFFCWFFTSFVLPVVIGCLCAFGVGDASYCNPANWLPIFRWFGVAWVVLSTGFVIWGEAFS